MAPKKDNSDIQVVVGVKGGASISGESGELIQNTLNDLIKNISKDKGTEGLKLNISKEDFKTKLKDVIGSVNKGDMTKLQLEVNQNALKKSISEALKNMGTISLDVKANVKGIASPPEAANTTASAKGVATQNTQSAVNEAQKYLTQMADLRTRIAKITSEMTTTGSGKQFDLLKTRLDAAKKSISELIGKFQEWNEKQAPDKKMSLGDIQKSVEGFTKMHTAMEKAESAVAKLQDKFALSKVKAAELTAQMQTLRQTLTEKESTATQNQDAAQASVYQQKLDQLKAISAELDKIKEADFDKQLSDGNTAGAISGMQNLMAVVENAKKSYRELEAGIKQYANSQEKSERGNANAINSLQKLIIKAKEYREELVQIGAPVKVIEKLDETIDKMNTSLTNTDLRSALDTKKIREFATEFNQISKNAKLAGNDIETLGHRINRIFSEKLGYGIMAAFAMKARQAIREVYTNVVELDSAMTELKKVTDATANSYEAFLDRAASRARKLGVSMTDLVNATADFARLGYSLNDAADLAETATVYKHVGDGIASIDDASESIISTMKAFKIEANDAISIVDRFNEVGNNYAISSKGVGDALIRSASALKVANNSIDESIALITAANTVVQDPEKVGTAMKTISMFLRAAKTEAQDAGIETEGMVTSVSKLRKEILQLTNSKVDIMFDDRTFKSTYQILKELAGVWKELDDVTKANLLEKLSGKRQANVTASILENFSIAEKALETSMNSAGSAMRENDKYLKSIQGKTEQLSASFQAMSNAILSSDVVKFGVDFLTKITDGFNSLNSTLYGLPANIITVTVALTALIAVLEVVSAKINSLNTPVHTDGLMFKILSHIPSWTKATAALNGFASGTEMVTVASAGAIPVMTTLGITLKALIGPIAILAALISLGALGWKKWKEAHPSLDDLKDKLEETKTKLDEVNSKLQETKDRIAELKDAKKNGTISVVEEDELARLERYNQQLELEARNLAAREKREQINVEKKAVETLDKADSWYQAQKINGATNSSVGSVDNVIDRAEVLLEQKSKREEIMNDMTISEEERNKKLDKLDKEFNKGMQKLYDIKDKVTKSSSYIKGLTEGSDEQMEKLAKMALLISKLEGSDDDTSTSRIVMTQKKYKSLKHTIEDTNKAGKDLGSTLLMKYEGEDANGELHQYVEELEDVGVHIEPTTEGFQQLGERILGVGEAAENAAESLGKLDENFLDDLNGLNKATEALATAQEELAKGKLTSSTLDAMVTFKKEMSDIVALYKMGLVDAQAVFDRFKAIYDEAKDKFLEDEALKIVATEDFYNATIKNSDVWRSKMGENYTKDYKSWLDLCKKKGEIDAQLMATLGANWSKYYSSYADAIRAMNTVSAGNLLTKSEWEKRKAASKSQGRDARVSPDQSKYGTYEEYVAGAGAERGVTASVDDALVNALNALANIGSDISFDFTDTKKRSSGSSSSGSKADDNKKKAEDLRKQKKHELEMEKIDLEEYYDAIRKIGEEYYSEAKENEQRAKGIDADYAEERLDIEEELFKGRLSILEDFINDHNRMAEKFAGLGDIEKERKEYETNLSKINDAIKKALDEGYQENSNYVQKLRDLYKDAASKITSSVKESYSDFIGFMDDFDLWNHYDPDGGSLSDYAQRVTDVENIINNKMRGQSEAWAAADAKGRKAIREQQDKYADMLKPYGINAMLGDDGVWYIDKVGGEKLYDNYKNHITKDNSIDFTKSDVLRAQLMEVKKQYEKGLLDWKEYVKEHNEIAKELYSYYKGGIDTLIETVMDMLKQRDDDKVKALEKQSDQLDDIIEKRKKLLKLQDDEKNKDMDIEDKVRELAKLRSEIEKLSLDDSPEANARRIALEEEYYQKNRELEKQLRSDGVDAAIEALDEQKSAFDKEKDDEINKVKEQTEKFSELYRRAIDYIGEHWDTLFDEINDYTKTYGNTIDDVIGKTAVEAWNAAKEAVDLYGTSVQGVIDIERARENVQSLGVSPYSFETGDDGRGHLVSSDSSDASVTKKVEEAKAAPKIEQMQSNSIEWNRLNAEKPDGYKARQNELHEENVGLSEQIKGHLTNAGHTISYDKASGRWLVDGVELYEWYRQNPQIYHKGGVVGEPRGVQDDEVLTVLQRGEMVLTEKMRKTLTSDWNAAQEATARYAAQLRGASSVSRLANDSSVRNFAPHVEVNISHNGSLSEADAKRYGNLTADTALERLREAFDRRGK